MKRLEDLTSNEFNGLLDWARDTLKKNGVKHALANQDEKELKIAIDKCIQEGYEI